ncbi:MAG: tol-pal system YbgF family protein [Bacteriovoracaceae bacterium]
MKFKFIPVLSSLLILSSCAWYRDLRRSLVNEDEKKAKEAKVQGPVSREQYNQLLSKYEELQQKYEQLKENPNANKPSLVDELQGSQSENFAKTSSNAETETVDVFAKEQAAAAASTPIEIPQDVNAQIELFRKGVDLKSTNPVEATRIFQQLENQAIPAVKVRAKFQVGEIFYSKQQYDLALQVFEDIINKQAHSGIVLDALKYAVVCSDKLGIAGKKDQYASMLNDVFGTN